ncbi:MAG TPA: ABC-2 transporter permease [Dyella sp.]|nr:ABC-2 transporter permease [Dyella sp.]
MKTFLWLVKREFWEHRGGFLWAPIVTAGVFLALNLMGIITGEVLRSRHHASFNGIDFDQISRHMDDKTLAVVSNVLDTTMFSPSMLVFLVMSVVVFFYCVNTLAEDRRDRSILFWKSLPLSDRSMVLSKVASAIVVAPVIATVVSVVAGVVMLLMLAIVGSVHGAHVWNLVWTLPHPFRVIGTMLGTLPLYLVWTLPAVGWLLLCSAWSRSKPFLWALALPLGAGTIVSWFKLMGLFDLSSGWFWLHIVGRSLLSVVPGGWIAGQIHAGDMHGMDRVGMDISPHAFVDILGMQNDYALLLTPPFWIGAIAGIVMIAGATWLRRWRTEM